MHYIKSPSLLMSLTALAVSATLTGCDLDFENKKSSAVTENIELPSFSAELLNQDADSIFGSGDSVSFADLAENYAISQQQFDEIDIDSSGMLSRSELDYAVRPELSIDDFSSNFSTIAGDDGEVSATELDLVFKDSAQTFAEIDADLSGGISQSELAYYTRPEYSQDVFIADFATIAGDDGEVSATELDLAFKNSAQTFAEIDADLSGGISQSELAYYTRPEYSLIEFVNNFASIAGDDGEVSSAELDWVFKNSASAFAVIDADASGLVSQQEIDDYAILFVSPEEGTVRVLLPDGWNAPSAYIWNDDGNIEGWPGSAMSRVAGNIYQFVIPNEFRTNSGIIFNDGAVQTVNLQHNSSTGLYGVSTLTSGNGCFVIDAILAEGESNYSGVWSNEYSCIVANKILFQKPTEWDDVRIYMWEGMPESTVAAVDWPGLEMVDEGNGIYSYTFPDELTSINVIFNNNNNGAQTSDLQFDATQPLNGTPAASTGAGCYNGDTSLWTNFANCESSASLMDGFSAHWIDTNTIAWNFTGGDVTTLYYSPEGALTQGENGIEGGQSVALTKGDVLTAEQQAKWPHLAGYTTYTLADGADTAALAKSQLAIVASLEDGTPLKGTQLQTAGALDALYGYEGDLGVIFTDSQIDFKLWAPTAQDVKLHVYDSAKAEVTGSPFTMTSADGVWSYNTAEAWKGNFYRYEVTVYRWDTQTVETVMVTDPYSVSLSEGSDYSQIVDLNDTSLKPTGWDSYEKPALEAPEDIVIYETHVRDFSILDQTVPAEHRGKFLAYLDQDSNPVKHLLALKEAGLTHVQLLPAFDIATINETAGQRVEITDMVDDLCAIQSIDNFCDTYAGKTIKTAFEEIVAATNGDTALIQQVYSVLRGLDGFNWGYDPYHYTVPEGSYATNAEGSQRILEYRELVKGLNEMGLRVVMDVVYNHTNSAGLADESVLDKIVPGYYQRRDQATGQIANSTCCSNTASEHMMMEKLMVDSLVTWAKQYKVDSFRFDLMGHHMKVNMEKVRDTLQALTLAEDGVDGSKIYLYGEGWNFGEVENGARGENAIQQSMAGTGIGTFSDRLRDMVRGGSPFDSQDTIRSAQGFANGLYYDPNELNSGSEDELVALMGATDMIRVGMAGNLKDYTITDLNGETVRGDEIPYGSSQMAGYTDDPQEVINYVSKHDNQTLFDNNAYKTPAGTDMATRVRIHNIAMDTVLLAQGIPFIHMGSDLMRSKSMQRNSYDSGDWFNWVDFSMNSNNWNMGLPRESEDGANWDLIRSIIADTSINPQQADIEAAATHFQEMLKIRSSSKLFRLRTKEQVLNQVHFMNTGTGQKAGLIAMHIAGNCELDTVNGQIMALINANDEAQTFTVAGASGYTLHPIQQNSVDAVVKTATFADGTFSVPARTSAVFVTAASCAQ